MATVSPVHGGRHTRGLTWVLIDGESEPLSRFAGVPPGRRPPATYPACRRRA